MPPGGWSSQRHWHEGEDEIVVMLAGTAVLVDDDGRHPMHPGDVAIFPKGDRNGHHLVNESAAACVFVALGRPEKSPCPYPDADRSEEHTSELQSLMRITYAVFCSKKIKHINSSSERNSSI